MLVVVGQHLGGRKLLWIEFADPMLVMPSRSSNADVGHDVLCRTRGRVGGDAWAWLELGNLEAIESICKEATQSSISYQTVILSEAKDLRRYLGFNCSRMVFNLDMAENRESASEKHAFIGGSFASLRMTAVKRCTQS